MTAPGNPCSSEILVELDGSAYAWSNGSWIDAASRLRPPIAVVALLNRRLAAQFSSQDAQLTDLHELMERAKEARDAQQFARAERLCTQVLRMSPEHAGALAVLCSALRAQGRANEAVKVTEAASRSSYPPLLTTRAAALCDLGRWDEARRLIARAIAIGHEPEALSVLARIRTEHPELY